MHRARIVTYLQKKGLIITNDDDDNNNNNNNNNSNNNNKQRFELLPTLSLKTAQGNLSSATLSVFSLIFIFVLTFSFINLMTPTLLFMLLVLH